MTDNPCDDDKLGVFLTIRSHNKELLTARVVNAVMYFAFMQLGYVFPFNFTRITKRVSITRRKSM